MLYLNHLVSFIYLAKWEFKNVKASIVNSFIFNLLFESIKLTLLKHL